MRRLADRVAVDLRNSEVARTASLSTAVIAMRWALGQLIPAQAKEVSTTSPAASQISAGRLKSVSGFRQGRSPLYQLACELLAGAIDLVGARVVTRPDAGTVINQLLCWLRFSPMHAQTSPSELLHPATPSAVGMVRKYVGQTAEAVRSRCASFPSTSSEKRAGKEADFRPH